MWTVITVNTMGWIWQEKEINKNTEQNDSSNMPHPASRHRREEGRSSLHTSLTRSPLIREAKNSYYQLPLKCIIMISLNHLITSHTFTKCYIWLVQFRENVYSIYRLVEPSVLSLTFCDQYIVNERKTASSGFLTLFFQCTYTNERMLEATIENTKQKHVLFMFNQWKWQIKQYMYIWKWLMCIN